MAGKEFIFSGIAVERALFILFGELASLIS